MSQQEINGSQPIGKVEGDVSGPGKVGGTTDIGKVEGNAEPIGKTEGTTEAGKVEGTTEVGKTEGTTEIGKTEGTTESVEDDKKAQDLAEREEVDSRSVYVGNVDFKSTPEQLENTFNKAGIIERVTILFDQYTGLPKGYAYIQFEKPENATKAIEELNGVEFRGRELRVSAKRTNLPRMSQKYRGRGGFRGRGRGSFRGRGRGRGSFRGRGRGRGSFRGRCNFSTPEPTKEAE